MPEGSAKIGNGPVVLPFFRLETRSVPPIDPL